MFIVKGPAFVVRRSAVCKKRVSFASGINHIRKYNVKSPTTLKKGKIRGVATICVQA